MRPMPFDSYGPGGYAGPARLAHLSEYRLRPNDELQVIYLITRRQNEGLYKLAPGDEILIESIADEDLERGTLENGLTIQPDGTITVRLLGQVHAAGLTVAQLREVLDEQYGKFYEEPAIDVTPVKTNTLAEDIRNAVGGQSGFNQQALNVRVMPDGKIRLPGIGEVAVQGFTLNQLKKEINLRYDEIVVGINTEPILSQQAPHFVHVLGQVATPNRIQLEGPTTVLGAISAAGGHLPAGNMRQVVIFRRAEDWRLISTMLDLQGAVYGKRPTPADEIWLRDGDVIIVPDKPITRFNNWVQQIFTDGIYRIYPIQYEDVRL
jgi:polysaccharide export outer membrane protein